MNLNRFCYGLKLALSTLVAAAGLLGAPLNAAAQAAPAAAGASVQYRLAAGDSVRIIVFQSADLSLEARINEAGVISYPLLGSVALGGLTVSQAEKRIADGLRDGNFVKQPQVNILVLQVRGHVVSVLGQVGRPGRYPLEVAEVRLTDMLATAGGVAATGGDVIVVVGTRDGKPFRAEVDLPTIFGPGRRGDDVILRNDDVIWVERAPMVYMYGEVQRPGPIRLERNMTLMQALATGGGVTQRGTEKGIRVHRRDASGKVDIMQPAMTDSLRPDDVIHIRESLF